MCLFFPTLVLARPRELLVVEKKSNHVSFYSSDGKRIAETLVGITPHEIVLSPDGRHAYVSDNGVLWMTYAESGGNTISIIDVEKRTKVGEIDLGDYRRPHGMDIDPRSGHLVVTIENPDGLLLVDPQKRRVIRKYDVRGKSPHMVTLGPKGEWAYVSNTGSARMAAVHLQSGEVKHIPTDAGPQGGVLSLDGKLLYLANSAGNSISIIDTDKQERVGTIRTSKGPRRIAITPDGRQLVYNLQESQGVGFANPVSRQQISSVGLPGPPLSLHLSADGKWAYAGVQSLDRVVVISVEERKIARVIHTPLEAGPDSVLVVNR